MAEQGFPISGSEEIVLTLSVNTLSFIIAGLRDCAARIGKEPPEPDDPSVGLSLIEENRETADKLERIMMEQLWRNNAIWDYMSMFGRSELAEEFFGWLSERQKDEMYQGIKEATQEKED